MTPFIESYGYNAPSFVDVVFGDNKAPTAKYWIQESQEILKILKENYQNIYADMHQVERSFDEGDLVFFRLQPYKYSSLKRSGADKLKS
jgi:hypothetical protein